MMCVLCYFESSIDEHVWMATVFYCGFLHYFAAYYIVTIQYM